MKTAFYSMVLILFFSFSSDVFARSKNFTRVEGYSEQMFREYCDTHRLDKIEGIWRTDKGDLYAIERYENPKNPGVLGYRMILLSHHRYIEGVERSYKKSYIPGIVRAYIEPSSGTSEYSFYYYRVNMFNRVATFYGEGDEFAGRIHVYLNLKDLDLKKVYPSQSALLEKSQKGSTVPAERNKKTEIRKDKLYDPDAEKEKNSFGPKTMQDVLDCYDAKKYVDALDILDYLIRNHPDDTDALYLKGAICYYKLKRTDEAIDALKQAEEYQKNDYRIYFIRANAYLLKNDLLPAIQDLSKVLTLKSDYTDAYYLRALVKTELGDVEGALSDLNQALIHYDHTPSETVDKSMIYNDMACCQMDNNDYDKAQKTIDEAIRLRPDAPYCLDTKGQICFRQERYDSCIDYMNRAIAILPSGSSYYWRGNAKYRLGQEEEALEDLSEAGEFGVADAFRLIREIRQRKK